MSDEDTRLEPAVRLSFFPGYYEDLHRPAGYNRVDESQSPVFNYVPRKLVAIGPDHQVDIPVWRPESFQSCHQGDGADASTSSGQTHEDSCDKWTRHCVMPMPDSNLLGLEGPLGRFKTECCCLDEGSIRCVRQHVMEARVELRSSLGHEQFVELGFCDMGEDVALGWTDEEEQLFHEVVVSNPPSLGKNFWDDLPQAFHSRSSKELVSYYFNVFMLRKRAEQNRHDPSNVDSDNDEWQEREDGEFGATEEDDEEDSGVESLADAAADDDRARGYGEVDIHEEAEEDYCEHEEYSISEGFPGKSTFGPNVQRIEEDQDVHDDSCTSYESQNSGADTSAGGADVLEGLRDSLSEEGDDGNPHAEYRNDGMSCMTDHDFIASHCDPKPWDISYFHGLDKNLDFLPTCNVIEEVFGNESWEKSREGHGVS